ncbi:alpha/beta hydrolase family protein [Actinomadura rugatobispora]|uniref:Alpha/beta hydrolase family protein n=1 Tax=Actinomadura rugatobispora TaxID=1994 RepID=A0ABW1A2N5_9ACTN|nr:lipase [Actinomadura rugatobispora]
MTAAQVSRRGLLAGACSLALVGGTATGVSARGASTDLRLPRPTGGHRVGTRVLHLVDHGREDPWVRGRARELMVGLWYPGGDGGEPVTHMTAAAGAHFGGPAGAGTANLGMPPGSVAWGRTRTSAFLGAPADRSAGRPPVVLYSPGLADPRTLGTTLAEELASRGYAVVAIDHTYESSEVEFPGGRLATSLLLEREPPSDPGEAAALLRKLMAVRVADTRFVLDRLRGLGRVLDLRRVGMAGHSAGGFTAAQAMHDDRRIRAAVNMDGVMDFGEGGLSSVARDGVDRPVLLLGSETTGDYRRSPSWAAFWRNTRGWKFNGTLRGSRHASFNDAEALLPELARRGVEPGGGLAEVVGTIPPERALAATRAYAVSFFDLWLRGIDDHLLDGPSDRFPEMTVTP